MPELESLGTTWAAMDHVVLVNHQEPWWSWTGDSSRRPAERLQVYTIFTDVIGYARVTRLVPCDRKYSISSFGSNSAEHPNPLPALPIIDATNSISDTASHRKIRTTLISLISGVAFGMSAPTSLIHNSRAYIVVVLISMYVPPPQSRVRVPSEQLKHLLL